MEFNLGITPRPSSNVTKFWQHPGSFFPTCNKKFYFIACPSPLMQHLVFSSKWRFFGQPPEEQTCPGWNLFQSTKVFFIGTYDMDTFYWYSSSASKGTFSPGSLDPQDSRLPSGRSHRDSSLAGQCTAQEQLQWRDGKVSQPEFLSLSAALQSLSNQD